MPAFSAEEQLFLKMKNHPYIPAEVKEIYNKGWLNTMRLERIVEVNRLISKGSGANISFETLRTLWVSYILENPTTLPLHRQQEEKTMSTPKHIEHHIFYGDTNIADMNEDQLFTIIGNIQKRQDNLKALKVKSKAIDKRLVKYNEDITTIVKHLDGES